MAGKGPPGKSRGVSVSLKTALGRTTTQQKWLLRQLNDPYVRAAREQGYRSRAAYKLIELDERYHLVKRGARCVDLGTAPGGWAQVLVERGAALVVGVDLLAVEPVRGATIVEGDFMDAEMPERLRVLLGGKADLVLSDMAPNTTGHTDTDHLRIMGLAELALEFAVEMLVPGGAFVAKVFQGGTERTILERMKRHFSQVRHAKPPASRKESSELYVVATGFKRLEGGA